MHEKYPEPNPVVISANRLRWALEMHQVNVKLSAEAAGNVNHEPKKRRWWQRKGEADTDTHRESEVDYEKSDSRKAQRAIKRV